MPVNLATMTANQPTKINQISMYCGLVLLISIGFFFRWRYIQEISLYVDEFTTIWAAHRILEFGWPIMPSGVLYTRGILSSYVEAAFLALFGLSYQVARLPSLLFSLATIPLIFTIGWREWNLRVGWLAAIGLTLLPEAIVWGGRARFYAQLQFFALLAVWAGLVSIRTEKNKSWLSLFVLTFVLALYSQEETLLLYPSILLASWLWGGWGFFAKRRVLVTHILCLIALALRYGLELWGQPGYFETIQSERPYVGLIFDLAATFDAYKGLLVSPERLPWTLFACLVLSIALKAWWQKPPLSQILPFHQSTIYFFLQFITPFSIILLFVGPTWRDHRYLFIIQPFWLLLGAAGAVWFIEQRLRNHLASRRAPSLIIIMLSLITFLGLLPVAQKTATEQQEGYDLALAFLASKRQPGDVILTPQPPACALVLGPCDYYAIQKGYEEYVTRRAHDGPLIDRWSGAPLLNSAAQLKEVIRTSKRTWFVTDSFRLATRYEADFIRVIIEQFDIAFNERGIVVLYADGWRTPPNSTQRELDPPLGFGPLTLAQWQRSQANAGQRLTITLYWQAAQKISGQLNTFVHLVAADGEHVIQEDGPPARGMVPTALFDEKLWPDIKILSLPASLPIGRYRLDVGAYELDPFTPLAAPMALDFIRIGPPPLAPTNKLDVHWKIGIQLLGYDPIPEQLSSDRPLTLRLAWSTTVPLKERLTFFIHLIAPDGSLIAQDDRAPEGGFYPTTAWDMGEIVVDDYRLTLPPDAAKGHYRIEAGLYRSDTGERLQRSDGGGDVVELGTTSVAQ